MSDSSREQEALGAGGVGLREKARGSVEWTRLLLGGLTVVGIFSLYAVAEHGQIVLAVTVLMFAFFLTLCAVERVTKRQDALLELVGTLIVDNDRKRRGSDREKT